MGKKNFRSWLFLIKSTLRRLKRLWRPYTRQFGKVHGFWLLYKLRLNRPAGIFSLHVPNYRERIFVRGYTADYKVFEEVFLQEAYHLPEVSSPRFIIDAGANVGYTSVYFAHAYPEASIIAIEPEEGNYEVMEKNTGFYPQIHPLKAALWSKEGSFELTDPGSGSWGFQVKEIESRKDPELVPGITLNALLKQAPHKRMDVVKIDVEGAERSIFSKNTEWLQGTSLLVMELHDHLVPGCRQAVKTAVQQQSFDWLERGGHVILRHRALDRTTQVRPTNDVGEARK